MTRKIKKRWIIIASILLLYLISAMEYRKFYCLENGKCVTVWYRDDTYYVIPYKYYGLFMPKDNYIKIKKYQYDMYISVYWSDSLPKEVIFGVSPNRIFLEVVNESKDKIIISNMYISDEEYRINILHDENASMVKKGHRDILYNENAKNDADVKNDVSFMWIDIGEERLIRKKQSSGVFE